MVDFHILAIDDDENVHIAMQDYLQDVASEDINIKVFYETDFDKGISLLDERRFDLVILDLRLDSHDGILEDLDAGRRLLESIRRTRFIPVIFYTALPEQVRDLEKQPMIQVLTKDLGFAKAGMLESIKIVAESQLPIINQILTQKVAEIQRDYMWDFAAKHWDEINYSSQDDSLLYLVARRLAISLSAIGAVQTGDQADFDLSKQQVPPERYYIMPPMSSSPMAGDIYFEEISQNSKVENEDWATILENYHLRRYWITLTPTCDLVNSNADKVILARCLFLEGTKQYKEWKLNSSNSKQKELINLMKRGIGSQEDRYFFLPKALDLPDLIVDYQEIMAIPKSELTNKFTRVSSLDSPFAEALLSRFIRFSGRLGTPDLNIEQVLKRLQGLSNPPNF